MRNLRTRYFPLFPVMLAAGMLLSGNGNAQAQTHYSSNVTLGVKAGADASRQMFYPSVEQSFKFGALGGVMFRYVEENHFGLIAELNFIQRGWKENFETDRYHYSRTLNYLELPVLTHIYFGRRGRFFFNAGPQIGLLIGESTSANFDVSRIESLPDFPYSHRTNNQLSMKATKKFDYGISAGLAGEFNINRINSLSLEARFYYGLGNIFPARRTDYFSGSNAMTISVSVGYWYRIK